MAMESKPNHTIYWCHSLVWWVTLWSLSFRIRDFPNQTWGSKEESKVVFTHEHQKRAITKAQKIRLHVSTWLLFTHGLHCGSSEQKMCFQLKIWQKSEQSKKWDFNRHDGIWCGTSSALITAHWESSVRLSDVVFASVSVYVYKNIDGWATSWKRCEKATHQHADLVAVNAPQSCIYTQFHSVIFWWS